MSNKKSLEQFYFRSSCPGRYRQSDRKSRSNPLKVSLKSLFRSRDDLSKFDGYTFTNFGKERGLPHPRVNDLIEARDGTYWLATNGGGVSNFNLSKRAPSDSAGASGQGPIWVCSPFMRCIT